MTFYACIETKDGFQIARFGSVEEYEVSKYADRDNFHYKELRQTESEAEADKAGMGS